MKYILTLSMILTAACSQVQQAEKQVSIDQVEQEAQKLFQQNEGKLGSL